MTKLWLALHKLFGRKNFDKSSKIVSFVNIFPHQKFVPYNISSLECIVTSGCLSLAVTMDTKSTDTNSTQLVSSSGVGELL